MLESTCFYLSSLSILVDARKFLAILFCFSMPTDEFTYIYILTSHSSFPFPIHIFFSYSYILTILPFGFPSLSCYLSSVFWIKWILILHDFFVLKTSFLNLPYVHEPCLYCFWLNRNTFDVVKYICFPHHVLWRY